MGTIRKASANDRLRRSRRLDRGPMNGRNRRTAARAPGVAKRQVLLRVIRCPPITGQRGVLRGQASDKPQGRKPRAGICRTVLTVLRQSYGDLRAAGDRL